MPANPISVWKDLLLLTQSLTQGLSLVYGPNGVPLPNAQVYVFKFPNDQYRLPQGGTVQFPCVQVCPGGREEMDRSGDTENITVVYPVLVVHAFASDHALALNNDELFWRQRLIDTFLDQRFPQVKSADVYCGDVDPEPPIDLSMFQRQNLDVGGLLLKFWASRPRPPIIGP